MIVIMNAEVGRAAMSISKPEPDGRPGPPEEFEAVVLTLGLGESGSMQVAMPLDLAETIGQGVLDAARMKVIPATMDDMPGANGHGL